MKNTIKNHRVESGSRVMALAGLAVVLLWGLLGANALVGGQDQTQTKTAQDQSKTAPDQAKPTPDQGKTAPDQAKITVESKAVMVFATVRDKHGQLVANLTKDDFAVDEDGKPQTITYFARENDLPLTAGLLVDTSL